MTNSPLVRSRIMPHIDEVPMQQKQIASRHLWTMRKTASETAWLATSQ